MVSSELALMETLSGQIKRGDVALENDYEQALFGTDMRLLPITHTVLQEAARLRVRTKLKTPDALHLV